MTEYLYPALFALGVWWASTILIIYLDGLPRWSFKYSMIGATVIFAISLIGLERTASDATVAGAYWAFTFGLLAWGWQEMSFYMGYVTGSRKQPCPEDCRGWKHFGHAIQTSLYHELAIIAAAVAVVWLTWGGPNQIGMWTFMVLWWMHQSAKLNVFLGVRNLNEEFLPEHLEFLKSFLTKRSMNLLFPFSVTISTVITALLVVAAMAEGATTFERAGYTFLAVLMALAILEHWMLVLPMPTGAIWAPGLKSRGERQPFDAEIVVGFLGAGKTTTLRRMLAEADPNVKTVVLVNDFGELGIDGSLLEGQGADVVELANGCICCSLRKDLSAQLREVVTRIKPQRVLIEPSGVADVASLLKVLHEPEIKALVKSLRLYTVIDAGAFLRDFARMPEYFRLQARLAPVFILNKTDLVTPGERETVRETLTALNPAAQILPARYGVVEAGIDPSTALTTWQDTEDADEFDRGHGHSHAATASVRNGAGHPANGKATPVAEIHAHRDDAHRHDQESHHRDHETAHDHGHDAHDHHAVNAGGEHNGHDHAHDEAAMGFSSWSRHLTGPVDSERLRQTLTAIAAGEVGEIARMKGIVRSGGGWLRFDVAGGHPSIAAHLPTPSDKPRALAIGRDLDIARLDSIFADLVAESAPAESDPAIAQALDSAGMRPAIVH